MSMQLGTGLFLGSYALGGNPLKYIIHLATREDIINHFKGHKNFIDLKS